MILSLNQDVITFILLVVFLISGIGIILIGGYLFRRRPSSKKEQRISRFVASSSDDRQGGTSRNYIIITNQDISKLREWINKALRGISSEKLQVKLSSAYWKITDTEYILIRIFATVLAFLLGWWIPGNVLGGIFLAAIVILVPPILLERATDQRQKKFHNQLLDVLTLIKGSVQAGYSLMQALDLAVNEVHPPASEEFGRILFEVRLGLSLEEALFNLSERMENDDLQIFVTAIIINAQVGGSLSTVLEATISTIRDRMQLQGEIRSLTSYARYVGNFLSLLPFIAGLIIFFLVPDYFDTVKTELFTQVAFLIALFGVIIGNIWIRRIVQIKV